jgi:hypothetical protein
MFAALGFAIGAALLALVLACHRRRSTSQFERLKERPFVIGGRATQSESKTGASSYI